MMTMMMLMLPGQGRKARESNAPFGALNERVKLTEKLKGMLINQVGILFCFLIYIPVHGFSAFIVLENTYDKWTNAIV